MTYLYICPNCNKEHTIDKPMEHSHRIEYCDECGIILKRVYESPSVITADGYKK